MSLPSTGLFTARLLDWEVSFDGHTWSAKGADFKDLFLDQALATETPRHQGHHLTVEEVGRSVLQVLFPDQWQEVGFRSDTWRTDLPEGGVD